ncbi:cilia- and flagella-associated 57-like, partial [Paramuricea clavata]
MSIASLTARHVFGIKGDVADNICYLDEQTIVFPTGSNCILYNIDQKSQRFIPGTDKSPGITAMAVSPNRRYVAIAERSEKAIITIYDLHTLRKRKVLTYPDGAATEYVSLAFSPDSKYLISQGGKPDWILLYWTWEKAKVMASAKATNQTNSPVHQISFNPQDNTQLCVVGQGIFKLFRYSEGNLKQFAFQKLDPQNFLSHAWLSDEKIVAGTDTGRLLLFESGELRNELHVTGAASPAVKTGGMTAIPEADSSQDLLPKVTSIAAFSKGFVCSGGAGFVHLFEKTDEKDGFKKTREIKVPVDSQSPDPQASIANQIISTLTVSPSEETLVCSTKANQMYSITMSSADLGK